MERQASWRRLLSPRYVVFAIFVLPIGGCATLFGWVVAGPTVTGWALSTDFKPEKWREASEYTTSAWTPRQRMVRDLMRSGVLDRLSESEVVELLGPPHEPGWPIGAEDSDIHYWLGADPDFLAMDDRWLFIDFDDEGRVEKYWLYTD